jgi:hypothetical protein
MQYRISGSRQFAAKLVSIKGKEIKIKIESSYNEQFHYGQEIILCTNWTLANNVLTFTGGNVSDVSDQTWNKEPIRIYLQKAKSALLGGFFLFINFI